MCNPKPFEAVNALPPAPPRPSFPIVCRCLVRVVICAVTFSSTQNAEATELLVTADTQGHLAPCQTCPTHSGNGGTARRATLLRRIRSDPAFTDGMLLDTGDALFGTDSIASRGQIIVAAYNELGCDAINLAYCDFRYGTAQTLTAVRQAKFPVISANLLDASTNAPLLTPYCVLKRAGTRWAVIGLTERPAGMDFLPHLQRQLAGVNIQPPIDALAQWLPKAKAESDRVILLYYGSSAGLGPIRETFGDRLAAILVGGIRPDELPSGTTPPIAGAEEHGKSIGRLTLTNGTGGKVDQIEVTPDIAPDPEFQKMLEAYAARAPDNPPPGAPSSNAAGQAVAGGATGQPGAPPAQQQPPAGPGDAIAPGGASPSMPARETQSPTVVTADQPPTTYPTPARPAAAAVGVVPHQNREPQGLAGVGLTPEQVNAAIDKGSAGLWALVKKEDLKGDLRRFGDRREHVLCALALVHAQAHRKFPDFDATVRGYLTRVEPHRVAQTYDLGLLCMLIEGYGDATFEPKMREAARWLLEAQGPHGTWSYSAPVPAEVFQAAAQTTALQITGGSPPGEREQWKRLTDWNIGQDKDNSVTQYALLGLQAASRTGIRIGTETWTRTLNETRRRECDDGGWGYQERAASSYGSMTSAGICAVAICRHELGEKDSTEDPAISRGLAWLDQNFSVDKNPKYGNWDYYYLYSLERVGRILDTEFIGSHEWYPLGADQLVHTQKPDGTWVGHGQEQDPHLATSFALLFLTRATPTLRPAQRTGPGTLRTSVVAPDNRFYIILDASGSMLDEMDGKMKFDLARGAVRALIDDLPPNSQVALRVYGHRKTALQPGADLDTELKIPMGRLDKTRFDQVLQSLRPRGKTPLALSLEQTARDLGRVSADSPVTVLLLTDGGEDTTNPRGNPLKAAAEFGKVQNVRFQIVGFDINQPDWSEQLQAMAQKSGARYWPAPRGAELVRSVRNAVLGVPDEYMVRDEKGGEVARGHFGEPRTLPPGKYRFQTNFAGALFSEEFYISPQQITSVAFDASKAPAGSAAPAQAAPASATAAPARATPKFCTNCGAPLQPGQKFCSKCGHKVGE